MTKPSPFQQSMVRLQIPSGMGSSVSARGFTVDADADGVVVVPAELAAEFMSHGLTQAAEPTSDGGKGKK